MSLPKSLKQELREAKEAELKKRSEVKEEVKEVEIKKSKKK